MERKDVVDFIKKIIEEGDSSNIDETKNLIESLKDYASGTFGLSEKDEVWLHNICDSIDEIISIREKTGILIDLENFNKKSNKKKNEEKPKVKKKERHYSHYEQAPSEPSSSSSGCGGSSSRSSSSGCGSGSSSGSFRGYSGCSAGNSGSYGSSC